MSRSRDSLLAGLVLLLLGLPCFVLNFTSLKSWVSGASVAVVVYMLIALMYLCAWCCVPMLTALFHFMLTECWPIALSTMSFNKLVVDVNVQVAAREAGISLGKLEQYFQQRYLLPVHVAGVNQTFNSTIVLPEISLLTLPPPDWFWLLTEYAFYLSAIGLAFHVLREFFSEGPFRSFEDGSYLCFTWGLPCSRQYRQWVTLMIAFSAILPAIWAVQIVVMGATGDMTFQDCVEQTRVLFEQSMMTGIALILALTKLGNFRLCRGDRLCGLLGSPPSAWTVRSASSCIRGERFNRYANRSDIVGLMAAFESNTAMGLKLLDAFWQAAHGCPETLQRSLRRERHESVEAFEERCHRLLSAARSSQASEAEDFGAAREMVRRS